MDDQMIYFMPSQIAMILGQSRRDILRWIEEGQLIAVMRHGRPGSTAQDIAKFLSEHPEKVGRVYCDDLIPFFNQARTQIVTLLENLNEVSNLWQDYQSTRSHSF